MARLELIHNHVGMKGIWMAEEYINDKDDKDLRERIRPAHKYDYAFCNLCGEQGLLNSVEDVMLSRFCPNCGAEMMNTEVYDDAKN